MGWALPSVRIRVGRNYSAAALSDRRNFQEFA